MDVNYIVSTTPSFKSGDIVARGTTATSIYDDFTVKVRVRDLQPYTTYYYRFYLDTGYTSIIGRTKTAPDNRAKMESVKFAIVSCQDYAAGFYTAYQSLAQEELDFCVHLGDFIYENPKYSNLFRAVRKDTTGNAKTLEQYRAKYRLYLTDPHLREARRQFPFVYIYDDHEIFNNHAGGSLSATMRAREQAAFKAYSEYIPIEHKVVAHDKVELNSSRSLRFGTLAEFVIADTRKARIEYPCHSTVSKMCNAAYSEDHTMLGFDQRKWLTESIVGSGAKWKFMLSTIMFMPLKIINDKKILELARNVKPNLVESENGSIYLNFDAWDGYPAERAYITNFLRNEKAENVVICSGDIHVGFSAPIFQDTEDTRSPIVAHELTGCSITSRGFADFAFGLSMEKLGVTDLLRKANPHMTYANLSDHGYTIVEAKQDYIDVKRISVETTRNPYSESHLSYHEGLRGA